MQNAGVIQTTWAKLKITHHPQAAKRSSYATSWWRSFASAGFSLNDDEPTPLPAASRGITNVIKKAKEENLEHAEKEKKAKSVIKKPAANQV